GVPRGDDLGLRLVVRGVPGVGVGRPGGAAAAEDQVYGAPPGVPRRGAIALVRLGGNHRRAPRVDGRPFDLAGVGRGDGTELPGVVAADRIGALVVVLVAGEHQVDLVFIEQRQPGLADAEVGA